MKKIIVMNGNEKIYFEKSELPTVESSAVCVCRDCEIREPAPEEPE